MKKIYFNTLIITITVLLLSSCENYFDEYFELQRPQETQWTTTATFDQGLNSCYHGMQWSPSGVPFLIDFCTSGNAMRIPGTNPGMGGALMLSRTFTERIMDGHWDTYYRIITMSNLAIDLHNNSQDGNPFNLDKSGTDYKDNYLRQVSEYYFARGYAYCRLMNTFAPKYRHNGDNSALAIPLKATAAYSKEDVLNEKIGTVEEVYQQIVSDLKYAKENLPDKFSLNSWNNVPGYECGRANKWVAAAMLGKVYFLMGEYGEAKAEFDELISYAENTGTYQLEQPKDPFNKERAEVVPRESIWEYNSGFLQGHKNYIYAGLIMGLRFRDSNGDELFSSPVNGVGTVINRWGSLVIGHKTLKEIGWMEDPVNGNYNATALAESDLRYQQVYHYMLPYQPGINKGDPEYITTLSLSGHSQVTTPLVFIDKFFRGAAPYGQNSKFPFIRLADIYLLRAWLSWKGGDAQGAADDLNIVWNRSNPSDQDKYSASNVDHDAIYKEYIREMTGEGWTVDFMMGTQMTIPVGDSEANAPVPPPYDGWHWPIPINEINLNPNYE